MNPIKRISEINSEIAKLKYDVRLAIENNDPETVMQKIKEIQRLDRELYDCEVEL